MLPTATRTHNQEVNGCRWIGQSEQRRARVPVHHHPLNGRLVEAGVDGDPDGGVSVRAGLGCQPCVFEKTHSVEHRKPGVTFHRQVGRPLQR
jgi:hypothetical protein